MNCPEFACRLLAQTAATLLIAGAAQAAPAIVVRNNHDVAYDGPVTFQTRLPAGTYRGSRGEAQVAGGVARAVVSLKGHSEARLELNAKAAPPRSALSLTAKPVPSGIALESAGREIARVEFAFATIPGREAQPDDASSALKPLDLTLTKQPDGSFGGECRSGDYEIVVALGPYSGGWLDADATVTRVDGAGEPAYVALVRRVTTPGIGSSRMRWYGRPVQGVDEPNEWHRDMWYAHGVDWCSWKSGDLSFAATSAFTPGVTMERDPGKWVTANRYYVSERVRQDRDQMFLISEIAGPSADPKPKTTSNTYIQPIKGEPMKLSWRLAVSPEPAAGWEEGQMLGFSGYRAVSESGATATVDLGTRGVEFGTSYFPYSTVCENHDFYRTPGLDRETWWPFSPGMWEKWREFIPMMRTDLRIIKAMGFSWVRLHHLELIGQMDRDNAIAFLDWYTDECRGLGLKVLIDTSGSTQWMSLLAGRYKDIVKRIEIENEVLIPGIKPGDAERWTECYNAAKAAAPDTQVFLTGNGNQGITERLLRLGVPIDRVGLHNYKHGPGWEEVLSSIALGIGSHGTQLGKAPTLGEFNWKELTRLSPEARARRYAQVFGSMLAPRAIPEFMQFHFQETMSVNPSICRQGIRHYESIHLDRRPKPEAIELMKLIRKYARPDAPVRELPVTVTEVTFADGKARTAFSITNRTGDRVTARLACESFGGPECRLVSPASVTIEPGKQAEGEIELSLPKDAQPGVYHFFLSADYFDKSSLGWGMASNPGAPSFDAPVLADRVSYPQGAGIVEKIDWSRPVCVAFGAEAPVLELEMAYLVRNTLQSAIGRLVHLCSTRDIPKAMLGQSNLVLVGSAQTNPLIAESGVKAEPGNGSIVMHEPGSERQWLLLTGVDPKEVQAAATDFVLRFWRNAKDSATRITGLEEGAALGHRATVGVVNPP